MASLAADPAISHSVKGQAEPQTVMVCKDPFVWEHFKKSPYGQEITPVLENY